MTLELLQFIRDNYIHLQGQITANPIVTVSGTNCISKYEQQIVCIFQIGTDEQLRPRKNAIQLAFILHNNTREILQERHTLFVRWQQRKYQLRSDNHNALLHCKIRDITFTLFLFKIHTWRCSFISLVDVFLELHFLLLSRVVYIMPTDQCFLHLQDINMQPII